MLGEEIGGKRLQVVLLDEYELERVVLVVRGAVGGSVEADDSSLLVLGVVLVHDRHDVEADQIWVLRQFDYCVLHPPQGLNAQIVVQAANHPQNEEKVWTEAERVLRVEAVHLV